VTSATRTATLREQTSWVDVTAATVVAVVVAVFTPAGSSIHPLVPVAITPALTAFVTVGVRRLLAGRADEAGDDAPRRASARRPPPLLHGGIVIVLVAASLAFVAAVVLVTAQDLVRGRSLDEGTLVGERIEVPDLTNKRGSSALDAVRAAGLEPEAEREHSSDVRRYRVIRTHPGAGTSVRKGSTVTVVISRGAQPVERVPVPDVVGKLLSDAIARIKKVGLDVSGAGDATDTPRIVTQVRPPVATRLRKGSLVVIDSAPAANVPGVIGASVANATQMLENEGFKVGEQPELVDPPAGVAIGTVTGTTPSGGRLVAQGSTVTLTVAALQVPEFPPGTSADEAEKTLREREFKPDTAPESSETIAAGNVIRTEPPAGTRQLSAQITIIVSSGPAVEDELP
jgi:beta-lactam-binding protein with PASTA domain